LKRARKRPGGKGAGKVFVKGAEKVKGKAWDIRLSKKYRIVKEKLKNRKPKHRVMQTAGSPEDHLQEADIPMSPYIPPCPPCPRGLYLQAQNFKPAGRQEAGRQAGRQEAGRQA
jgi:hypothetical protein